MMENKNIAYAHINIDTTEAKENIEELTLVVNECIASFEKLEKVMSKYTGEVETVELYCNGEAIARTIVQNNE